MNYVLHISIINFSSWLTRLVAFPKMLLIISNKIESIIIFKLNNGFTYTLTYVYNCPYGSGVEHFLGKEEVVSSSLTMGSRRQPDDMDKCVVPVLYSCPYRLNTD